MKKEFVNWPFWEDTGEGGLIVHLFVLDNLDFKDRWEDCIDDNDFFSDLILTEEKKDWYYGHDEISTFKFEYIGRQILLAMKFSSTNEALWNGDKYFTPSFSDLTKEGKEFITIIKNLYPNRILLLGTTLDT